MSTLKEIQESHDAIKGLTLNLFLIPFWYVAIFIFNNEFYNSADIFIKLAMCLVLTIPSTFMLSLFVNNPYNKKEHNSTFLKDMIIAVTILVFWLSSIIFITYSIGFFFKRYIYFYTFITIYFSPIIILNVLQFLFAGRNNQSKK